MYALAGVTEEIAARSPAVGKWSVLECVEHLAVYENYLFSQIEASRPAEGPAGRFSTLAEALRQFLGTRERTLRFVETCGEDLRSKLTSHPILGTVNCHETLLMIAVHPHRHARQIAETKAALLGHQ